MYLEGDEKISNLFVIVFAFLVIIVVTVGFAASFRPTAGGHALHSPPPSPLPPKQNSSKATNKRSVPRCSTLDFICTQTDYVSSCTTSLTPVSNQKENATHKQYIEAAIHDAIQDTIIVKNLSKQLAANANFRSEHQALNDCHELLSLGSYDLNSALGLVSNSSELLLIEKSADVKNWLSAALAYQEACRDGLQDKTIKLTINDALQNPKQKTSNALAIVESHVGGQNSSDIIKPRNLISEEYRSWFSSTNRKLLEGNNDGKLQPDAVVAADGSGQFRTIQEALKSYKLNSKGWYVIYVKAGVYDEHVFLSRNLTNVYMYGDGIDRTTVSGSKQRSEGFPAYRTATVAVLGEGFVCKSMTIENRATSDKETVALRVQADKAAVFRCKIEGLERSLYALAHRQFYRECIIIGTKDIIFGDSATIIQNSQILVRKSPISRKFNTVTAQARTERTETTGFVLHGCNITQEQESSNTTTYLGRPGGRYSRTIILQSYIGNVIDPEGWITSSSGRKKWKMLFAEFENHGPGADTARRVKMEGVQANNSRLEAAKFTPRHFIQGNSWLDHTGVSYWANLL